MEAVRWLINREQLILAGVTKAMDMKSRRQAADTDVLTLQLDITGVSGGGGEGGEGRGGTGGGQEGKGWGKGEVKGRWGECGRAGRMRGGRAKDLDKLRLGKAQ